MIKMHWPWKRRGRDEELSEEIDAHFRMAMRDHLDNGMAYQDAEHAVRREFGNVLLVKEVTRDMWGWRSLDRFWQELRFAVRALGRSPGFAALSILTLALGIGVNTAMFSVIDGVLLKPLAYRNPDRLVTLYSEVPRFSRAYPVLPIFRLLPDGVA